MPKPIQLSAAGENMRGGARKQKRSKLLILLTERQIAKPNLGDPHKPPNRNKMKKRSQFTKKCMRFKYRFLHIRLDGADS